MSANPRRPARWTRFVRRYGWRAYALPLLTVVTIVVAVRGTPSTPHRVASGGHSTAASSTRGAGAGTAVEGLTAGDADFHAGATPAPVVVSLGADTTSCATNGYRRLVLVSISAQHLWACDGHRQVNSTPVTTGRTVGGDQTPLGSWRVQAKQRNRYLVGPGYRDYVHYWVPFNGDFGLHDAPWQTMPFGSKDWHTGGSHGCVHVPTPTMTWLYQWSQVGATVVTIKA